MTSALRLFAFSGYSEHVWDYARVWLFWKNGEHDIFWRASSL
jgi:hypothetical protein